MLTETVDSETVVALPPWHGETFQQTFERIWAKALGELAKRRERRRQWRRNADARDD